MIILGHGNLIVVATVKDKTVITKLLLLIYFSDDNCWQNVVLVLLCAYEF